MKNRIMMKWRFWKNPNILTLQCDNKKIAIYPDIICSYYEENGLSRPKYNNSKGEETYIDTFRLNLFIELRKIIFCSNKKSIIQRVIFCRQGIDIELMKDYNPQNYRKIMNYIEEAVRNIFHNFKIVFQNESNERTK